MVLLALGAFSPSYGVQNIPPHNYSANQNDVRLAGTVIDEIGIPVIGANILAEGTTNGTATGMDDKFASINVPENAILVASYTRYLDHEIPVAGKGTLGIRLKEDTQKSGEVVVVGYGV